MSQRLEPTRFRPFLLAAGIAGMAALLLLPKPDWPAPVVILVHNPGPDSVLVDTRWWGGPVGVDGPVARVVAAGSTLRVARGTPNTEICVRVIDTRSREVSARVLPEPANAGDSMFVSVIQQSHDAPRPDLTGPCSPRLETDRVLVDLGRFFDPREPDRIRRERIIRRY